MNIDLLKERDHKPNKPNNPNNYPNNPNIPSNNPSNPNLPFPLPLISSPPPLLPPTPPTPVGSENPHESQTGRNGGKVVVKKPKQSLSKQEKAQKKLNLFIEFARSLNMSVAEFKRHIRTCTKQQREELLVRMKHLM